MNFFLNKKNLLIFIIFVGIFFRLYNLNFENLWYDEIISFWVANPLLSFHETTLIHNQIETTSILYNLILKYFFKIFGYEVHNGRLLSFLFGTLSIFSIIYLNRQLANNNSYIFSAFLISLNIFLIGYSQEMRNYSLFFFITSITIIFFIKLHQDEKKITNLILFTVILFLNILIHPFGLIILFSIIFFELIKTLKTKYFSFALFGILISVLILSLLFYFKLFNMTANTETNYWWMKNPSLSFYTNFYFSNYFGSRLVGSAHLFVLVYLLFKNFKEIKKVNYYTFFLILIIFSYLIPILFGYLFKPTILPRYVMFNLISIILLISTLTFNFERKRIKFLIIFILSTLTLGNHFTEQTVQQLYQKRLSSKPEYSKALDFINNSGTKKFNIIIKDMKNNTASLNAIKNYINYLNSDLAFFDIEKNKIEDSKVWLICPLDINSSDCDLFNYKKKNLFVLEQKQFNSIILKLIQLNIKK